MGSPRATARRAWQPIRICRWALRAERSRSANDPVLANPLHGPRNNLVQGRDVHIRKTFHVKAAHPRFMLSELLELRTDLPKSRHDVERDDALPRRERGLHPLG